MLHSEIVLCSDLEGSAKDAELDEGHDWVASYRIVIERMKGMYTATGYTDAREGMGRCWVGWFS